MVVNFSSSKAVSSPDLNTSCTDMKNLLHPYEKIILLKKTSMGRFIQIIPIFLINRNTGKYRRHTAKIKEPPSTRIEVHACIFPRKEGQALSFPSPFFALTPEKPTVLYRPPDIMIHRLTAVPRRPFQAPAAIPLRHWWQAEPVFSVFPNTAPILLLTAPEVRLAQPSQHWKNAIKLPNC